MSIQLRKRLRPFGTGGQGLVEFAIALPLVTILSLGVVEASYALLDQNVITRLSREGSNLISRDVSLEDAGTAIQQMATAPVNFASDTRAIFTVLKKGSTPGTANYDQIFVYARNSVGGLTGYSSKLSMRGAGSFRGAPDYSANNPDTDGNLQVSNVPVNVDIPQGGVLYVTEVYTKHTLLTPLDRFGITFPQILYSIAYF